MTDIPNEIIAECSPEIIELTDALRLLIRQTIPSAKELMYRGWKGIGYHHPESGYFCALFPRAEQVNLGFEWGVDLPDPDNLLQGTGKRLRYVVLTPGQTIPEAAIRQLLLIAAGEYDAMN
ncbi:MAG: DUF1801 domain-containing protein [Anaerolineae bacterium]|jgi:hypothetical protein|nr:DUF1801 domain-containing protein [Anaerolineae bacterium]